MDVVEPDLTADAALAADPAPAISPAEPDRIRHALYARHRPAAFGFAYLVCGDRDRADDAVQEAFERVMRRGGRLRRPEAFGAYLHKTVLNVLRSRARSETRARDREVRHASATGHLSPAGSRSPVSDADPDGQLWAALEALPDRQRAAVVCRIWLDLSEADTASVLGCRPGTVKSLLPRAAWPRYGRRSPMPEPDDLQERLAAMAERRVAGADRPAHLPARSHRRIRRGERIGTGLATLVVVALVAGGVAVARSGQEQATTVRVWTVHRARVRSAAIPPGLADQVRALALLGTHVPGATPRAVVVYHPTGSRYAAPSTSAGANVVPTPAEAWEVVISGEHFVPSDTSFGFRDPTPHRANSESWDLDSTLDVIGAAVPGPNATELTAMGSATPVALDHRCVPGPSSTTTLPPTGSTSTTTASRRRVRRSAAAPRPTAPAPALAHRCHRQSQLRQRRHGEHHRHHSQRWRDV